MSDLPPADWYEDPHNHRQYRYWDGDKWTDHQAPRDLDGEGHRPVGQLLSETFAMIARRWRDFVVVSLVAVIGTVAGFALIVAGGNELLDGELFEVIDRVTSPGFDPESAENEAYFESLEVTVTTSTVVLIALGTIVLWAAALVQYAAVAGMAASDMLGSRRDPRSALAGGVGRLLRLTGLTIFVIGAFAAAVVVLVGIAIVAPISLIITIPLLLGFIGFSMVVIVIGFVAAAVGPRVSSLRYAHQLVRGRFWPTVGRLLLIWVVAVAVGIGFNLVTSVVSFIAWWAGLAVSAIATPAQTVVQTVATVIVYRDLGGEIEADIGA